MRYSKYCIYIICLLIGITSVYINQASAADYLLVIENGKINFNTISTKATSSTRYKTIGFTITREARCTSKAHNADCRPQQEKFGVVKNRQVAEIPYGSNQVKTYFEVDAKTVLNALKEADSLDIKDGDIIYLSAIFHVLHGSSEDPTDYTDLRSIKSAEPWADPVDFILKTVDGTKLAEDKITDTKHPEGLWKTGETIPHTLPSTFEYQDVTYTLNKSYIQST